VNTRRVLIMGGAALAAGGAAAEPVEARRRGVQCRMVAQGVQACEAGVMLPAFYRAQQQRDMWCWAACIQMVFEYYGHPISQAVIVQKLFGSSSVNQGAIGPQIAYAVTGQWVDAYNRPFQAQAEVLWDTQFQFAQPWAAQQAIGELVQNRPLIIGANRHATMLTAIAYRQDVYGQVAIDALTVRDPWPASPARRTLNLQEAQRVTYLTKIYVSR
jgi:hypothetical protein